MFLYIRWPKLWNTWKIIGQMSRTANLNVITWKRHVKCNFFILKVKNYMNDLLILLSSRYCISDLDAADSYTSTIDTMETFYLIFGFSCSVFWLILLFCCLGPCLIWCRMAGNGDTDLEAATPGTSIVLPQGYIGGRHLMRDRAKTSLFWTIQEMLGHRLHNSTSSAT